MGDPKCVLFYMDDLDSMEQLSYEEKGRLFTALLEYARDGETNAIEGNERFLFPIYKKRIDRDFEKYLEKCERNRKNAEKRWHANACDRIESDATVSQKCQEEEKNKNKNKNKKEEEAKLYSAAAADKVSYDYDSFREIYNRECGKLPSCRTVSDDRKKAIREFYAQFKEDPISSWTSVCKAANNSAFLTGDNDTGWRADFEFLLRPKKAVKAIEGGYDFGRRGGDNGRISGSACSADESAGRFDGVAADTFL